MNTKLLINCLFICSSLALQSQIKKGKIISKNSKKPIYGAAVLTNLDTGTSSDRLGLYYLDFKNVKTLTFSCLGYQPKKIDIKDLIKMNYTVALIENVNQLDEIQLNLKTINLDSLLYKTQKNMRQEYINASITGDFYTREYSKIDFKKLELDLEKSTLLKRKSRKQAAKELIDYATKLRETSPEIISKFVGKFTSEKKYSKKNKNQFYLTNIDSIQGISTLHNTKKITLETAQKDLQNIVLKHLDTNNTYKLSSGLFKIEDSLSLKKVIKETDSLVNDNSFDKNTPSFYINNLLRNANFFKTDNKNNFLSKTYYEHHFKKNEYLGNKLFYTILFKPKKSKAKFSGKIFIDPIAHSIKKITYSFAEGKRGQHFNLKWLLGIKIAENINTAELYYEKNKDKKIYCSYFKETEENYAYVHRPVKFKENSKEKEKAKFDITLEVNVLSTKETLLNNINSTEKLAIEPKKKNIPTERIPYLALNQYQETNWKNRALIVNYLSKYN